MTQQRSSYPDDIDAEAPAPDVYEQRAETSPAEVEQPERRDVPLEADAADAADQDQEIPYDEDDYRS